jgi:hypothetical protein
MIHIDDRQAKAKKKINVSQWKNDQSIGLLRRKDNHIRRMRIREESITLNISSRAISDCCCNSNLPDRNKREREKKNEGIVLSLH